MRKLFMTLIILIAFAFSANAQMPSSPFSFYAGGLVSLPNSPEGFSQLFKMGWHGMAGVGYSVAPKIQAVAKVEYHTFGMDFGDASSFSGGNNKIMMYGLDGRFNLNIPAAPIAPYIFGGAGMANVKYDAVEGTSTSLSTSIFEAYNDLLPEAQNKMYYNFGAGMEMKLGPAFNFFVQARYVSVNTDGEATGFIPVSLGLKFF